MIKRIIDQRNKEKFQVDDAYLNGYAKICGINATGVYMALCRHASNEQECFPSKRLIAEKLNIGERTVYDAIKKLEMHCVIKVTKAGRKKDGKFKNLTYILLDKSEWIKTVSDTSHQQSVPTADDDNSQRQDLPNKETHMVKETNMATVMDYWNKFRTSRDTGIPSGKIFNKSALNKLLPECKRTTPELKDAYSKLVGKGYGESDFKLAIDNYVKEILLRNPASDYAIRRFSFYEFIKQDNGFVKFINK
ncbi:MAG: helix-turn-helix domain-containing protein [bacterium]|nr:helix-turn-helix domain-containing protein [bacterium]